MFRRCISTLVLIGFVAGQVAALPHTHAGLSPEEQLQHDSRPHLHFGNSEHSHNSSHDGQSPRHSHEKAVGVESPGFTVGGPCSDHDDDAIYFPGCGSSLLVAQDQRTATTFDPSPSTASGSGAVCLPMEPRCDSIPLHPPNGSLGGKLYLTLRTLRI